MTFAFDVSGRVCTTEECAAPGGVYTTGDRWGPLGTRDLNFKAREKFCTIILLISEILLLFLLFNSPEAKYYHNNANCIDFSKRVNYYYESIMAHFTNKSEDSKFLRTQSS